MDDLESGVFIRYKCQMNFVRVITNYISPCEATITCDLLLAPDVSQFDLNVRNALERMKAWIAMKENGLFYSNNNPLGKHIANFKDEDDDVVHNEQVLFPYEPVDDAIALFFMKKFNAICHGFITIASVSIEATDSEGIEITAFGDHDGYFPTMTEWMGESTFFNKPWWDRADSSSIDTVKEEHSEETPDYATPLTETFTVETQEAKILRPTFKPRIIDGDRDI